MGYWRSVLLSLTAVFSSAGSGFAAEPASGGGPSVVLYEHSFEGTGGCPELVNEGAVLRHTDEGLHFAEPGGFVRLDRYYALAERSVRYHVRFSADTKAVFRSDKGDFILTVDVPARKMSMATVPVTEKRVDCLRPGDEYIVEIERDYQTARVRIINLFTGEAGEMEATMSGSGGCGAGAIAGEFFVGRQYDYYCFGLEEGSGLLVKGMCVLAGRCAPTLLLYGDSITEPEGYFPAADYSRSWVQLIARHVGGGAVSSGRGGTTIRELMERIRNELPYVRAKYVMVTIGTNGGNTEENLSELVEYIAEQGSVPILNNIPCNESGTQTDVNALIDRVRRKYGIRGCRFDLATSVDHDGERVDETLMWLEDYGTGGTYFHHPNVEGSKRMYLRTLIDVPEIYE